MFQLFTVLHHNLKLHSVNNNNNNIKMRYEKAHM